MLGYAFNTRFFLFSNELKKVEIPPYKNFSSGNGDVYERNKKGKYFEAKKSGKLEMFGEAYDYLRKINVIYGIIPEVRLIIEQKRDDVPSEDWVEISNLSINLRTLDFNDSRRTVKADTEKGGILDLIEKRFDDEYDISDDVDPFAKQVLITPRRIVKRSRLDIQDGTRVLAKDDTGATARGFPFQVDFKSEEHIVNVFSDKMNSVNDTYADLKQPSGIFILNAPFRITYKMNGRAKLRITNSASGFFNFDMVFFGGGSDFNYLPDKKIHFGSLDPDDAGAILDQQFNDFEFTVEEGESVAIATVSKAGFLQNTIEYEILDTFLELVTETPFPQTFTKAIKPFDLFQILTKKITENENPFDSDLFRPGGKYENVLLAHGTWLRNVPKVINEGKEDERKVLSSISMKNAFDGYSLLEPLMYDSDIKGLDERFFVNSERSTQLNNVGVRLGETSDRFNFIEASDVEREVMGDDYYGRIHIGSNKSGDNREKVNNLYSICGNAKFTTINKKSDTEYTVLSDFRTSAEDVELQRQVQYDSRPDLDSEMDDDWFFLDCKIVGGSYVLKGWQDHYETVPENVFSAETNYNWIFSPLRLLLGHGWKIKVGLNNSIYGDSSIKFLTSNCSSSLITKKAGEPAFAENGLLLHKYIKGITYLPMRIKFKLPLNQEIVLNLKKKENLNGLIEFLGPDGIDQGRLIKVDTNGEGKWELIEARIDG